MTVPILAQALTLAAALSADALFAAFAYGSRKIRIPPQSVLAISLVCGGIIAVACALAGAARQIIPGDAAKVASFAILFILGVIKLFDSGLKSFIRKNKKKEIRFTAFHLSFILHVYADPQAADRDESKLLSVRESIALAFALSLDGVAAGIGAGLTEGPGWLLPVLALVLTAGAVTLGGWLGGRLAQKRDLGWLSGVILIILAFFRL